MGGRRTSLAMAAAAAALVLCAPVASASVFLSQAGAPETLMLGGSGCSTWVEGGVSAHVCGDTGIADGPPIRIRPPGLAILRFDRPVSGVGADLRQPGGSFTSAPVARIDDTQWNVDLRQGLPKGAWLTVHATGGSFDDPETGRRYTGWDASAMATILPAPPTAADVRIAAARMRGGTVIAALRTSQAGAYTAHVTVNGRRASANTHGALRASTPLSITLRRRWRGGRVRLVVKITTASGSATRRVVLRRG